MTDEPRSPTEIREEVDEELQQVEDEAHAEEVERLAERDAALEEAADEEE